MLVKKSIPEKAILFSDLKDLATFVEAYLKLGLKQDLRYSFFQ